MAMRGVPREPAADLLSALRRDLHTQNARRTPHHAGQITGGVVFQSGHNAEAIAQGRGNQAHARGGPYQGKRLQINFDRARGRTLADDQIQLEILHGRIEDFLHRNGHAMDFIHKEYVMSAEIGEDGRQIPAALQHRAGSADQVDAQFCGHDLRQSRLAQARIAVKQRMIQRLAALSGRAQVDAQIGAQLVLADEVIQTARAHAFVQIDGRVATALRTGRRKRHVVFEFRHQALPLASALSAALSVPVTSRSGSACNIFLTRGAHSSSA